VLDNARQRDLAEVLRAVAAGPAGPAPGPLLEMAVAGGLEAGPGVIGCSITELDGSRYRTTAYAGEPSLVLDLVQYRAGRGPCLTALQEQRGFLADDPAVLAAAVPGWAQAAARLGVGSVLSLPLPGLPRPAGINFYGAAVASFAPPVVAARAALVGRLAGQLLGRPEGGAAAREGQDAAGEGEARPPAVTEAAERRRALVIRARAVTARTEAVSEAEAFARLARRSAAEQRSIEAVARDVLDNDRRLLEERTRDDQ
jgi:hypothetical protein